MLAASNVQAVHIKGGWMYYEYKGKDAAGNNLYTVVVKVYRDCSPPNAGQNDTQIVISFFDANTNARIKNITALSSREYRLEKSTFSDCINPKPQVCYVILEYTGTVSLPPVAGGYIASFQRCCRINGIVNVIPPSNSFGNTYMIKLPGNEISNGVENSSPRFIEKDTVAVCYNSPIELDYSATDPDGDSLVYSFTSALSGASQSNPTPAESDFPPFNDIPYQSG